MVHSQRGLRVAGSWLALGSLFLAVALCGTAKRT
jgi:hypothetical protein